MRTEGGVEELRAALLAFFGAQPEDYYLVFTRSGSGALHLVGETFPWSPASSFSYLTVNHNSVLGIRDVARQRGAAFGAVDEESVKAWLADPSATPPQLQHHQQQPQERSAAQQRRLLREPQLQEPQQEPTYSLFAYPSYDNFAGTLYPLEWVRRVQAKSTADHRWLVGGVGIVCCVSLAGPCPGRHHSSWPAGFTTCLRCSPCRRRCCWTLPLTSPATRSTSRKL